MNRSAKGLLIITTTLDGFSLANHRQFTKFAKLSTRQTFPLYDILSTWNGKHLIQEYPSKTSLVSYYTNYQCMYVSHHLCFADILL